MTLPAITRQQLGGRDAADPPAGLRGAFTLPDDLIYLGGHSLGPPPRDAADRLDRTVRREWGQDPIRSWTAHDWIGLPLTAGDKIASMIGAEPGEVVVADSTSINLFKLLAAALRLNPERRVALTEAENFPTENAAPAAPPAAPIRNERSTSASSPNRGSCAPNRDAAGAMDGAGDAG